MKNLKVYPTFMIDVANGFGLIKLADIPKIIEAYMVSDSKDIAGMVYVTNNDEYNYYQVRYGKRSELNGQFPYLMVVNENDNNLITLMDVAHKISFTKKSICFKSEMGVDFKIKIKTIEKIYAENSWRLKETPKTFFESQSMNALNLKIGFTMLHAHDNHMQSNFVYGLFNEAMNSNMIEGVTEWMYDRWLADIENDEFYDVDLMRTKLSETFGALTTTDGNPITIEFNELLGLYVTYNGKTFVYNITDYCDSSIFEVRDRFLNEIN